MPIAVPILKRLTVLVLAASLGACGSSETGEITVATIGNPDDPFETGVHLSLGGQLARASAVEGLVAFDEQGRIIPALADRWIVTDDGRSYIFRLRDGTWRDGEQISARSAVAALHRAIGALRGTALGLDLEGVTEIREMAGRVVEIELSQPMPHLLQLLAQPELGLTHDGQGAGPMTLERQGDIAVLEPIRPEELGLPARPNWEERTHPVRLVSLAGEQAVQMFNRGEVDIVLGGRIGDFPLTSSVGILRGTIQLDPVIGLFGLQAMNAKGFLSEAANREAIAMAIDRDEIVAPFGVSGWTPSTRIVSASVEGDLGTIGERWNEMSMEERRALAAARVARWRQVQAGKPPVRLGIWLPGGPGSDMLYRSLAKDLAAAGIETTRASAEQQADLSLIDIVARYPRATWFLNRLNCKVSKGACDSEADARVREAEMAEDPAERAALLAEAEADLTEANVFIPLGPPIRWSLVRGNVDAFSTNRWGWHPLMPIALLPK